MTDLSVRIGCEYRCCIIDCTAWGNRMYCGCSKKMELPVLYDSALFLLISCISLIYLWLLQLFLFRVRPYYIFCVIFEGVCYYYTKKNYESFTSFRSHFRLSYFSMSGVLHSFYKLYSENSVNMVSWINGRFPHSIVIQKSNACASIEFQ